MKVFRLFSMALIALTMLSSCDFFRSLVGKPTSKDLERMRIEAQAKKQRQLDSLNKVKADSLAALALQQEEEVNKYKDRFYVVLGSFKVPGNAEKMFALLEKNNYTPMNIKFKNGFELVSAASTNNIYEACKIMDELLGYEFCPDDVWIYDTKQGLHE